jgi:plastocyanin
MAANIKLKRSAVIGKQPQPVDLDYGELALNYSDGVLYYKNASNAVSSISGGGATTDSAAPVSSLRDGTLWWDATNGKLKIYYVDEDAQTSPQTISLTSNASGNQNYEITGSDRATTFTGTADPNIYIIQGDTLQITQNSDFTHPMYFVTQLSLSNSYDAQYNVPGVTNQGAYGGVVISHQFNSVGTFYYICSSHPHMVGVINVVAADTAAAQWVDASIASVGYTGSAGAIFQGETAPSNPTDGQIWYDSTTGKSFIYYTNPSTAQSQWVLQADPTVTDGDTGYSGSRGFTGSQGVISPKFVSIESPTSGQTKTLMYNFSATTVSVVRAGISGGTSVAYSVYHDAARNGSGTVIAAETTTNVTSGSTPTIISASVPAGSWIWVETTTVTGTVNEFNLSIEFTE